MSTSAIQSRLSKSQWVLKPQDLALAFKLKVSPRAGTYSALAASLRLSVFEAHSAAQRLIAAGLAIPSLGGTQLNHLALKDFVICGAGYAYPAVRTDVTMGFPTAHAVEPLKSQIGLTEDLPPIWPHPEGMTRGVGLLPLYPKLPLAAAGDPKFYELLSLFDALRIGQARERKLVREMLEERLA